MENEKKLEEKLDGELFLSGSNPPTPPSMENDSGRPEQDSEAENAGPRIGYKLTEQVKSETTWFERVLFKTKDPTSLPHTREKCVKYCRVGPIKTCCGWKIQYRWIYVTAILRVTTTNPANIKDMVEDCLTQGAIVAAITAVISGGTAAVAAAEAAFKTCLISKLGSNLVSVNITLHHNRGDWE